MTTSLDGVGQGGRHGFSGLQREGYPFHQSASRGGQYFSAKQLHGANSELLAQLPAGSSSGPERQHRSALHKITTITRGLRLKSARSTITHSTGNQFGQPSGDFNTSMGQIFSTAGDNRIGQMGAKFMF